MEVLLLKISLFHLQPFPFEFGHAVLINGPERSTATDSCRGDLFCTGALPPLAAPFLSGQKKLIPVEKYLNYQTITFLAGFTRKCKQHRTVQLKFVVRRCSGTFGAGVCSQTTQSKCFGVNLSDHLWSPNPAGIIILACDPATLNSLEESGTSTRPDMLFWT